MDQHGVMKAVGREVIAKQRNGPTGEVPLTFLKQYTRFESRAETREPAEILCWFALDVQDRPK